MNISHEKSPSSISSKFKLIGRSRIIDILFLMLLLFGFYRAHERVLESFGVDYYQFWAIAREAAQGNLSFVDDEGFSLRKFYKYFQDKYSSLDEASSSSSLLALAVENRKEVIPTGTPFFYGVISLLSNSNYEFSLRLFQYLSAVLFSLSILYLMNSFGYSIRRGLLFSLYLLFLFDPLVSDLRVTNVNQFEIGLIGLYFLLLRSKFSVVSSVLSMTLLTLLAFFKPNIIFAVFLLLLFRLMSSRRERLKRELLGFVIALPIGLFFHNLVIINGPSWYKFYLVHDHFLQSGIFGSIVLLGNYSIMKLFVAWAAVDEVLFYYLLVGGVAFFSTWGLLHLRNSKKELASDSNLSVVDESAIAIGVGCAIFLLVSPLVWIHYYLLVVPLMLYLLSPQRKLGEGGGLFRVVTAATLCFSLLIFSLEHIGYYLKIFEFKISLTITQYVLLEATMVGLLVTMALFDYLVRAGYLSRASQRG